MNNNWQTGLSGKTAVGKCGAFDVDGYPHISNTTIGLSTCVINGLGVYSFGKETHHLGAPTTSWNYQLKTTDQSWTGMALQCTLANNESIRMDFRSTLPGPLYNTSSKLFSWDWAVSSSPAGIMRLPSKQFTENKSNILQCGQIFYAKTKTNPILFVTSQPVECLESVSWEHWRFHFKENGAKIMIVPLLCEDDIPYQEEQIKSWLSLINTPPLYCREEFNKQGQKIEINSFYTDENNHPASCVPIPPTSMVCERQKSIQALPEYLVLLQTVHGPYAVANQPEGILNRTIKTKWINTKFKAQTPYVANDKNLPFELAYAGDSSWDENHPMDQLLSWRLWGQVFEHLSPNLQNELKARVKIPNKEDFQNSLLEHIEPVTSQKWLMDKTIFAAKGEVSKSSYDVDWYNGLMLSGLARAGECSDKETSEKAKKLAKEIKAERKDLIAYYQIFNDWALGAPWTDARGELFNFDCGHNGLEAILAERKFCLWEGDNEGAAFMEYLAAKMSLIFIVDKFRYGTIEDGSETYGPSHILEWRFGEDTKIKKRAPYNLAGDFPEFNALLREYGPRERHQKQADAYHKEKIRYEDWLTFYLGEEKAAIIRKGSSLTEQFGIEGTQEAREQAAVFYLVSPLISLHIYILEESHEEVIKKFKAELPLLAKIHCLAKMALSTTLE